jgi:hypothetical protein
VIAGRRFDFGRRERSRRGRCQSTVAKPSRFILRFLVDWRVRDLNAPGEMWWRRARRPNARGRPQAVRTWICCRLVDRDLPLTAALIELGADRNAARGGPVGAARPRGQTTALNRARHVAGHRQRVVGVLRVADRHRPAEVLALVPQMLLDGRHALTDSLGLGRFPGLPNPLSNDASAFGCGAPLTM